MARSRRGSWTVTTINGSVAGLVLVLVAVLALVVNPPAPPGIAAFAPQASKPITKAPPGQSAQFGNGAGQCGAGQVCAGRPTAAPSASAAADAPSPTPSPTPLHGAVPPGLQCYQWPDGSITQTFDPQSPPCVSTWDDSKGNGGATAPGVSATEIRVALPVTSSNSTWPTIKPIVDFFNTRFQLYGRKIRIVPVHSQQSDGNMGGSWNDPALQRADAAQIRSSKVFATLDFMDPISESSVLPVFLDAMAKAKIVTVAGGDVLPLDTLAGLQRRAPYAWSYYPTLDQLMVNLATMTCRQLAGRPASHASDASLRSKTRKFALVLPTEEHMGGPMPGLKALLGILDGCGVHAPKVVRQDASNQGVAAMSATMQQLKSSGVTSVIYLPYGGNGRPGTPMSGAQSVGFRPEWLLLGWYNYNTAFVLNESKQQTASAFGIASWNKQPQLALEFWNQAITAVDGGQSGAATSNTGRPFYQELLLLASGIQQAGPRLTPQSFAQGLHDTQFPNPGAARAPFFQGTVGFPGDSPVMVNDYSPFWLDNRTSANEVKLSPGINESKAFCMVGLGRRWDEGTWPTTDGFYTGGCR